MRISQAQLQLSALSQLERNRNDYLKYSDEVSSGLKASNPGDTLFAATIVQNNETLQRLAAHKTRVSSITANLSFQDDTVSQANDLLVRAKEIATQGANESLAQDGRSRLADEVFALRDQLVNLANSKYQGNYIFGGLDDDDAPFDSVAYTTPATGPASRHYAYDATSGVGGETSGALERSVVVADGIKVVTQIPGSDVFSNAINALETLGRSLQGFRTSFPAPPLPPTGAAYNFPSEFSLQTSDIQGAITSIETARSTDLMSTRVTLGSKLKYLDTILDLLGTSEADAKSVISNLQEADIDKSASLLKQSETALQASYAVTSQLLRLSGGILEYL